MMNQQMADPGTHAIAESGPCSLAKLMLFSFTCRHCDGDFQMHACSAALRKPPYVQAINAGLKNTSRKGLHSSLAIGPSLDTHEMTTTSARHQLRCCKSSAEVRHRLAILQHPVLPGTH